LVVAASLCWFEELWLEKTMFPKHSIAVSLLASSAHSPALPVVEGRLTASNDSIGQRGGSPVDQRADPSAEETAGGECTPRTRLRAAQELDEQLAHSGDEQLALSEGDKVEAKYEGQGKYYPGKIKNVNADGTYHVLFDDYDVDEAVAAGNIKLTKELSEGDKLEAKYKGKGKNYLADRFAALAAGKTEDEALAPGKTEEEALAAGKTEDEVTARLCDKFESHPFGVPDDEDGLLPQLREPKGWKRLSYTFGPSGAWTYGGTGYMGFYFQAKEGDLDEADYSSGKKERDSKHGHLTHGAHCACKGMSKAEAASKFLEVCDALLADSSMVCETCAGNGEAVCEDEAHYTGEELGDAPEGAVDISSVEDDFDEHADGFFDSDE
jgi:hypothetical protein